jgi:hypothetical protein
MAKIQVNFDTLRENHPSYKEIKGLIGGPLLKSVTAGKWETCCIQVSYALNHSGAVIEKYDYHNARMGRKVRAMKSDDEMNYVFEVTDLTTYLNGRYGIADHYKGGSQAMKGEIGGRQGIIAFGTRHIDLWEGDRFHWQHLYKDLWAFENVKQNGVYFWDVASERERPYREEQRW